MDALLGPEGCPWDQEQTHQSLAKFAIEEATELADAIDQGDTQEMVSELGDVLLQVVFHSKLGQQSGQFNFGDVCETLIEKMVRRHPHVFTEASVNSSDEVKENWEKIKALENPGQKKKSLGGSEHLSALHRCLKIGEFTKRKSFDWSSPQEVWPKVDEELLEFKEATTKEEQEHEFGDILFALVQLARHHKLDPEQCLRKANHRFEQRYHQMMEISEQQSLDWEDLTQEKKESLWQAAKEKLKQMG